MDDQSTAIGKGLKETVIAAFTAHPRQGGESYWQHFAFTLDMAGRLALICLLLVIHGILPFTLTHAASVRMKKCQRILADRAARTGFDEISGGFGI
jgi:hypothetical protein